ncbi:YceI family protein [Neolewinella aurantiaca]|uniref:YceI family protein n=1 Tax=Neolewinella aurantiaca TaxID=2602767 RepID=A0A5C7FLY0_9BACT|nr:YceI family protein [Neolewinella aurantiaca]TXF91720.1 YceI family protein [Neolewinella aurantiaca]
MIKAFLLFSTLIFATAVTLNVAVDTSASQVTWKGYKVTGSHEGTVSLKEGSLDFTDGVLTGGAFTIDMASLKATDITGESAANLEGHLKSDDFFGTESFPVASFTITKVVSRGSVGDYRVTGDLTIKGTTKTIRFNTKVTEEMGKYTAKADLTIDRTDFGVRYGSGSFIDNLGDKTIYDEFELGIVLVTKK